MKMNAKKLTLALVALLLALTCVFVACKKDEPQPVDDKPTEQTADRADLVAIADQFNKDYYDNYLNLYSDDTVVQLEAAKSAALLKIAAAKTTDEAREIANAYIKMLKDTPTLAQDVESLIKEIGKVSLADQEKITKLSAYNTRLLSAVSGATGAKKTILDAYKKDTAPVVQEIEWRLSQLKVAKLAADLKVNPRITAILEKVNAAAEAVLDGELEDDTKIYLTFLDYEELFALDAAVDTLLETYEIDKVEDKVVYDEILKHDDLKEAWDIYTAKTTKNQQIQRALAVKAAAEKLAPLAVQYQVGGETEEYSLIATPIYIKTDSEGPFYFVLRSVFAAAEDADADENKVLVTYGEVSRYVNKADVYAYLPTAWADLNTIDIYQVTVSGAAEGGDHITIEIPKAGAGAAFCEFKLVEELQAAAKEAAVAASDWAKLLDSVGNDELEESFINKYYHNVILPIIESYNKSLAKSVEDFNAFKEILVAKNYVDTFPKKDATTVEDLFTTDTQTMPTKEIEVGEGEKETVYDDAAAKDWKTLIQKEWTNIKASAQAADGSALGYFDENGDYVVVDLFKIDLHENEDGTYTPAYTYTIYTYLWKAYNLARTAQDVEITDDNTDTLGEVLENVNEYFFKALQGNTKYYELATAMKAWVEKYLVETPSDLFALASFKTVKEEKVHENMAEVEFGDVKVTFAGTKDKLAEEPVAKIVSINGADVEADPSEALDISVYADYEVALAAIAEYERLVAEKAAALEAVKKAVKAMFAYDTELDAITKARTLYTAFRTKYEATLTDEESALLGGYNTTIKGAEDIRTAVLELYPHAAWNKGFEVWNEVLEAYQGDRLDALKQALADANEAVTALNSKLTEYDEILERAEAELTRLEAGNTIGYDNGKKDQEFKENRLINNAVLKAQQDLVKALREWRKVLTEDFATFKARNEDLITLGVSADEYPELMAKNADTEKYTAEIIVAKLGEGHDDLAAFMADIMNGDKKDAVALAQDVVDAQELYDETVAKFAEEFKLEADKSFGDYAKLNTIISDLKTFLAGDQATDEDDHEYLNLNIPNDYTGNLIDLFSSLFNERIMAGYYRSVELTRDYCEALTGSKVAVDEFILAPHVTSWTEYATNQLKEAAALSDETFRSFAEGEAAVKESWRSDLINYRWAVDAINAYEEDDVASYEELVYEEKNDEEGYQFPDNDNETVDDVPGILITGVVPH